MEKWMEYDGWNHFMNTKNTSPSYYMLYATFNGYKEIRSMAILKCENPRYYSHYSGKFPLL